MITLSLFNSSFLKSFDFTDYRQISMYDLGSLGGFPGVEIIMTFAIFKSIGLYFSLKDAFIKFLSLIMPFWEFFCTLSIIRSYPAFLD